MKPTFTVLAFAEAHETPPGTRTVAEDRARTNRPPAGRHLDVPLLRCLGEVRGRDESHGVVNDHALASRAERPLPFSVGSSARGSWKTEGSRCPGHCSFRKRSAKRLSISVATVVSPYLRSIFRNIRTSSAGSASMRSARTLKTLLPWYTAKPATKTLSGRKRVSHQGRFSSGMGLGFLLMRAQDCGAAARQG